MLVVQSEICIQKDLLPLHTNSDLRYSYETITNNLYEEIINLVDNANEYLFISTYNIVALESLPEFTMAIKNAVSRQVKVVIFCRGMNYRHDHLKGSEIMYLCGSEIYADIYNHSKGIINESKGMIFTANIDGNYGLKNGFEVGYILSEEQRKEFLDIHHYLVETSYYKFIYKPNRIDFFNTYIDYEMRKGTNAPIFPKDIIISKINNINNNENSLFKYPLFYGKAKDNEYLIAGDTYYRIKQFDNTFEVIEEVKPQYDLEKYCLKHLNLKIISN